MTIDEYLSYAMVTLVHEIQHQIDWHKNQHPTYKKIAPLITPDKDPDLILSKYSLKEKRTFYEEFIDMEERGRAAQKEITIKLYNNGKINRELYEILLDGSASTTDFRLAETRKKIKEIDEILKKKP